MCDTSGALILSSKETDLIYEGIATGVAGHTDPPLTISERN